MFLKNTEVAKQENRKEDREIMQAIYGRVLQGNRNPCYAVKPVETKF